MATTTNYSWTTPDDTDLVKDGAAAIRTLGSSIDTTTKNLNPSTTLGDIEYRSGTANTNTRLAIGSTGNVLTVSGGVPVWSAPAAGATFVGCSLFNTTNTTVANNTATTLLFDSEYLDTDSFHSTVTNTGRITIPSGKNGKYLFELQNYFDTNVTGFRRLELHKNGVLAERAQVTIDSDGYMSVNQSYIISAVATDYFTMVVTQDSGGNLINYQTATVFQCTYLGA